jgi:nucleoid DNA-binding protein
MNYLKDCVEMYARKRGITVQQASKEFKTALDVIEESIVRDGGVSFVGRFTISRKIVKARRRVLNGESYDTNDKVSLSVSVGKFLKEKLNNGI